jgi:hypothetical protein
VGPPARELSTATALCLLRSSGRSYAASFDSASFGPNPVRSHRNAESSRRTITITRQLQLPDGMYTS